jgi:hypothetical protein
MIKLRSNDAFGGDMRVLVLALCAVIGAAESAAAAETDLQTALRAAMQVPCEKPGGAIFDGGIISNGKTALFVATRILTDIYGPDVLKHQTLAVEARGDRYVINGVVPKNYIGGNATMIMCRSNGKVVFLTHTK